MDLEQHHMIKFSRTKSLKLREITPELFSAYGLDAQIPPSITYWLHQIKLGRTDLWRQHAGERPPFDNIDAESLSFLRKYPFSSVRTIAEVLEIPTLTIYPLWSTKLIWEMSYFVGFPIRSPSSCSRTESNSQVSYSGCLKASRESASVISWHMMSLGFSSTTNTRANMVHIGRWRFDKSDAYDSHPKIMLIAFLSVDGVMFMNWPTSGKH
jgi:hypothetical protein